MTVATQKIEIVGTNSEHATVRLYLADRPEQDQPREWLWGQISSDARDMNQLAAIELRALQRLRTMLALRISDLEARLAENSLRPG